MTRIFLLLLCLLCTGAAHAQGIITTVAGTGVKGYSGDGGPATAAQLSTPYLIALDTGGNYFFVDSGCIIRYVSKDGIIRTYAGSYTGTGRGDGGQATNAVLSLVRGLAIDNQNNVYEAEGNTVRKITPDGIISIFAGNRDSIGFYGSGDGGPATAANVPEPWAIAADRHGNIFFSNNGRAIRKVTPQGIISTYAGNDRIHATEASGDGGPATAAAFDNFLSLALDTFDNLYVADAGFSGIRKIDSNGIVTALTGKWLTYFANDGGPATAAGVYTPTGLWVTPDGRELYIAQGYNGVVRKIDSNGIIWRVAGGTYWGPRTGDGGDPLNAWLNVCIGIVKTGNRLLITDAYNRRIRAIDYPFTLVESHDNSLKCNMYPNPSDGKLFITFPAGITGSCNTKVYNTNAQKVHEHDAEITSGRITLDMQLPAGVYSIVVTVATQQFSGNFTINK